MLRTYLHRDSTPLPPYVGHPGADNIFGLQLKKMKSKLIKL